MRLKHADIIATLILDFRSRLAESRPLNAGERAQWSRIKKKLRGRPRLGLEGVEKVSVSVEKSLLKQADAYAKSHNLKRSQMFADGLRLLMVRSKAV
jgi:hypothetical protein